VTARTRTLTGVALSVLVAAVATTLLLRGTLIDDRVVATQTDLLVRAELTAELLAAEPAAIDFDVQADALGAQMGARVTLVDADGVVRGDSAVDAAVLGALDNHATRPEIAAARAQGRGVARRTSRTTGIDTIYAAVPVASGPIAVVRLAHAADVAGAVTVLAWRRVAAGAAIGLAVGLVWTWISTVRLQRRTRAIVSQARRFQQGDFSQPEAEYGEDELGRAAGALDEAARALGADVAAMTRDRAHTDAILGSMAEGVLLVNRAGRLVRTNAAARSMLRLPDPATDRHYLEAVRDPAIAAQLSQALTGQPSPPVEIQIDRERRLTVVAHVVPLSEARGGGAVLVLHDVTERRQADQVRRDFVANVSHELRTPLTAIRGYVEALMEAPPPDQARRFLDIIARHTQRMERLVRDLLRLARLDAGQEPLERGSCALAAILQAIEHEMEPQLEDRGLRLELALADDAGTVQADPSKLHNILRNLIENAANYSPDDGTITVTSRRDDDWIEIAVADRGPGIPESEQRRIFERFYRVDRSRSRDPGGTGLGLSIVRHLVELHGGRASAHNRPGGGAIVSVTLPG